MPSFLRNSKIIMKDKMKLKDETVSFYNAFYQPIVKITIFEDR